MSNYNDYTAEDFLSDEYFVEWVHHPSDECKHFWEHWLSEHPEKAQTIQLAKQLMASLAYKNNHYPTPNEKAEVLENIMQAARQEQKPPRWSRASKFAAAAIVVITLTWWGLFNFQKNTPDKTSSQASAMVTKQTAYGEKRTLRLPDGTTVKLNYGSTLTFPEKFSAEARKVKLSGEAFFEIKANAAKPFVVDAEGLVVTVVGTSFNVKAYASEQEVQVAIATGKVKVQTEGGVGEALLLLPEEIAILNNKKHNNIVKRKANLSDVLAWKDGTLVLSKATFEQAIEQLEKWYGVRMVVEEGLKVPGRFTGRFENQPLENVLIGLGFSNYVHYTIEDKLIKFYRTTNEH